MSHIATFRKKQYALSGEPDSSSDDNDQNTGANDLVFDDEGVAQDEDDIIEGAHAVGSGEEMLGGSDDDDDMLLCVGTTDSSNPHASLDPSNSIIPPPPPPATTTTSVFDQIGATYVPPPRPIPTTQQTVANKYDHADEEDEEEEVIISKYTQLKASAIRNGEVDVSAALHDVGDEGDMLLLDDDEDDDDSADDEMARMRLADDLQAASAGMSHEEVLELLEEFSVQKKHEREVKRALRAKLEEQKRFREKLKVKGNNRREVEPAAQAEASSASPEKPLPQHASSSRSTKEEAFLASDPRHSEYLDPGLAAFLADMQQGTTTTTPSTTTSSSTAAVQRIQAPIANPTATATTTAPTTITVAKDTTKVSTSSNNNNNTIPPPKSSRMAVADGATDDDFYDHDVAEHRMQNQLSELLSEFGASNQRRPDDDTRDGVYSSTTSPSRFGGGVPPSPSSSSTMAVGNDFLRERRNSRLAKEGNTGAISGAIPKGSHGVFGGDGVKNSDSPSRQKSSASSSIAQHFSVARIAPVHTSHNTTSIDVQHVHGSVLQITDPRVREALPVSEQIPPSCSSAGGDGGSRSSTATNNTTNKTPGAAPRTGGSATSGGRRVGSSSRASSSAAFERKSSVASSMASAIPLSQQMAIKLEEENRVKEKQRRQLEADRERRLEKKRQAERDQYGLPPINPQGGVGGIAINNGLSLGPQVNGGGVGNRRSTSETVSVSAMPYHQRQQLAQEGIHTKTPTPPATPQPPYMTETSDARRRKSSHGQGAKGSTSQTTTTTTVGGFSFMKKQ